MLLNRAVKILNNKLDNFGDVTFLGSRFLKRLSVLACTCTMIVFKISKDIIPYVLLFYYVFFCSLPKHFICKDGTKEIV